MAKSLNFNNIAKKYFTVTLADEKNTTVMIGMPTKALLEALTNLDLKNAEELENDLTALEDVYRVSAQIMSRNKGGIEITKEYLEEVWDFEDVVIFLREYMTYVTEAVSSVRKN